jgi:hypothetical protein
VVVILFMEIDGLILVLKREVPSHYNTGPFVLLRVSHEFDKRNPIPRRLQPNRADGIWLLVRVFRAALTSHSKLGLFETSSSREPYPASDKHPSNHHGTTQPNKRSLHG